MRVEVPWTRVKSKRTSRPVMSSRKRDRSWVGLLAATLQYTIHASPKSALGELGLSGYGSSLPGPFPGCFTHCLYLTHVDPAAAMLAALPPSNMPPSVPEQ